MAKIQLIEWPLGRADGALSVQEGYGFEKMVRLLVEECSRKGVGDFLLSDFVRGYWNRADGSGIEIDLVAYNEDERVVRFGSCKRTATAHDAPALTAFEGHVDRFLRTKEGRRFSGWASEKVLYAPAFGPEHRELLTARGYLCFDLHDFEGYLTRARASAQVQSTGGR